MLKQRLAWKRLRVAVWQLLCTAGIGAAAHCWPCRGCALLDRIGCALQVCGGCALLLCGGCAPLVFVAAASAGACSCCAPLVFAAAASTGLASTARCWFAAAAHRWHAASWFCSGRALQGWHRLRAAVRRRLRCSAAAALCGFAAAYGWGAKISHAWALRARWWRDWPRPVGVGLGACDDGALLYETRISC